MHNDSIQGIIFSSKRNIKFRQPYTKSEKFFEFIKHPRKHIKISKKATTALPRNYTTTYIALQPKSYTKSVGSTADKNTKRRLVLR